MRERERGRTLYAVKHEVLRLLCSWCLSPEIVSALLILDGRELPIAKVANKYNNLGIGRRCFAWKEDALLGERERETWCGFKRDNEDSIQFIKGDLIFYECQELI